VADVAGVAEAPGVGEERGVTDVAGVAEASGVAEDRGGAEVPGLAEAATLADACGEPMAAGEVIIFGVGKAAALLTSLSRTPTRLLCRAVRTVRSKVRPKKMHPRYTVALVRTVAV
jgi:hypothetical protein